MSAPSDPEYRKNLGKRLKIIRKERKATQKEIAQVLGINYQQLNKYECGQNLPPAEMLVKISNALGVTTDYLLTGQHPNDLPVANSRLLERFRALEKFSMQEMETVITVIDAMVARRMASMAANPFQNQTPTGITG
jgi:transcriptional regulator with XRE-family HTH domain